MELRNQEKQLLQVHLHQFMVDSRRWVWPRVRAQMNVRMSEQLNGQLRTRLRLPLRGQFSGRLEEGLL